MVGMVVVAGEVSRRRTRVRSTARSNVVTGGLQGGAGSAWLGAWQAAGGGKPGRQLGLRDQFIEHGDPGKLLSMQGLDAAGIDRVDLARIVMQNFLRHALRDGFFHADMHQGNLFATRDGKLVAVDLGIIGRLGQHERRFLAEILFGFITPQYRRLREVHFRDGFWHASPLV